MTPTKWRRPRTGDKKLRVTWRGTDGPEVSKYTYTAKELVWEDRGHPFDIVAVEIER